MKKKLDNIMECGKWNKLPHYVVVGRPTDFYVWVNEDGHGEASKWLKGSSAFSDYLKLQILYKNKDEFCSMVKRLFEENRK